MDVNYCTSKSVLVANVPLANAVSVAETVIPLSLKGITLDITALDNGIPIIVIRSWSMGMDSNPWLPVKIYLSLEYFVFLSLSS